MNPLSVLALYAGLLLFFGLVMARDMIRRPADGFFRPAMIGLIPVLFFSLLTFEALQRRDQPEVSKLRDHFVAQLIQSTASLGQQSIKPEEAGAIVDLMLRIYPGLMCLFWLFALSLLAVLLRYWLASRGSTRIPGPLTRWKAPDALIWMALLPAALVLFGDRGLLGEVKAWQRDLCLNVLVVSLAIYLFQGALVILEKLSQVGVPKVVGGIFVALGLFLSLLPEGKGLGIGMVALGLLETWFDFRNLQKKDNDEKRSNP